MKKILRRRMKRAQGMTEYIIIVGLIAIILITAVRLFGQEVNTAFSGAKDQISNNVVQGINSANAGGGGGAPAPGG